MKELKNILIILSIVIVSVAIVGISFFYILFRQVFPKQPTVYQVEKELQQNSEHFDIVAEYLLSADYESITIRHNHNENDSLSIEMFAGLEHGDVLIEDVNVSQSIHHLFGLGYSVIGKSEEGVRFLRWSTLDKSVGVVYWVHDGIPQPSGLLQFLVDCTPLSEENWYYYVQDYNEWRRRNSK